MAAKKTLTKEQEQQLLEVLKMRFEKNMQRHKNLKWEDVENALFSKPAKLYSLNQMEETGGEPDVVEFANTKDICFIDCAPESPKGRRSFCYDREALNKRKEHKPENSAVDAAAEMGAEILTEEQYRLLQDFERIDQKTSSWVHTPEKIRKLGGALFCDRRYDNVFTYHNGADSYYAARGFRMILKI